MGQGTSRQASPAEDVPTPTEPDPEEEGLTDAERAARMHVLEPKDRGRVLTDFYAFPDARALGRGHYGEVRKVVRKSDGQVFALKTITKKRPIYVEILKSEVAILSDTDHPGIIKMVDKFEDGPKLHLVFEICTGGELFEPIADSSVSLTERQSSRVFRKILEAVYYLHSLGIVHRDLKPENVLLKQRGIDSELKVIDFGLACFVKPGEVLTRHVGTPYYIAPEILARRYDKEADVWSLGVILFTLLSSGPPFYGDTEREIYRAIQTQPVAFDTPEWSSRSDACQDLVLKMLTKSPQARLRLEQAMQHTWVVHEGDVSENPGDPRTFARLFARLRRYGVFPTMKKLVMLHVAHKLLGSKDRSRSFRPRVFFSIIDKDGDGAISATDLSTFLRERDAELRNEEVRWIVEGLSMRHEEHNHAALLPEFTAAVMPRLSYLRETSLLHEFAYFDRDCNGVIDAADLAAVSGIGLLAAERAVEEVDLGQEVEGGIDFGTFVRIMAGGERDAI